MQTSQRPLSPREEHNKAVVLDYYDRLCRQWDFDAARQHIGEPFIQHNPGIADGIEGVRQWVAQRPPFTDALRAEIRRVLVDGDFVVLHTLVTAAGIPEMPDMAIADFFRLDGGKVVEHWDVIQPVPPEALHGNGMV